MLFSSIFHTRIMQSSLGKIPAILLCSISLLVEMALGLTQNLKVLAEKLLYLKVTIFGGY